MGQGYLQLVKANIRLLSGLNLGLGWLARINSKKSLSRSGNHTRCWTNVRVRVRVWAKVRIVH